MAGIYTNIMETAERITANQGNGSESGKAEAVATLNKIENSESYKNFAGSGASSGGWVGALIGAGSGKKTTYETPNETNKNTFLIVAVAAVVLLVILNK